MILIIKHSLNELISADVRSRKKCMFVNWFSGKLSMYRVAKKPWIRQFRFKNIYNNIYKNIHGFVSCMISKLFKYINCFDEKFFFQMSLEMRVQVVGKIFKWNVI